MAAAAQKSDPALWDKVKARVTQGEKGGKAGQWSARKAQLAVQEYKKAGGGYRGKRDGDNHLRQWEAEGWGTKSGRKSGETGERYLPRRARETLSDAEYDRSTAKKRADTAKGQQFSRQPVGAARKAAAARKGVTKESLMAEARKRDIPGRSRMTKVQLEAALGRAA
ncbi:hypothetical protein [Roseomonas sp. USHLN139]|uniref:hypothetical protein n=1 Tax=Roseomonas sp. USHLN139 TaxID=3081298 RepID=UPI003B0255BF